MLARKLMVGLMLVAFVFAAATVITTSRVNGTGKAVDSAGRRGTFSVDATKVTHNHDITMRGTFDFTVVNALNTESTRVHLNSVDAMNVVENVATFGGPGVLRVAHGTELHYYEGRVYSICTSNRHPGEIGSPDRIVVRFVPAVQTNPSFVFEGSVTDGDIAVTTSNSY